MRSLKSLFAIIAFFALTTSYAAHDYGQNVNDLITFTLQQDDGTALTGATITSIDVQFVKDDGTTVVRNCVASSPSGSDRICAEKGNGLYTLLTVGASDLDQRGRLTVTPIYTGATIYHVDHSVVHATTKTVIEDGGWGELPDMFETVLVSDAGVNTTMIDGQTLDTPVNGEVISRVSSFIDNAITDLAISSAAVLKFQTGLRTVRKNESQIVYVTYFNVNGTRKTDMTTAQTCKVSLNGSTTSINVTNGTEVEISDTDHPGTWAVFLDQDELNGDSGILTCQSGSFIASSTFQPQH